MKREKGERENEGGGKRGIRRMRNLKRRSLAPYAPVTLPPS